MILQVIGIKLGLRKGSYEASEAEVNRNVSKSQNTLNRIIYEIFFKFLLLKFLLFNIIGTVKEQNYLKWSQI